MQTARFFYHSFPRDGGPDASARALATLQSVIERGLLLTPERLEFREELSNGGLSPPWYVMQKRISFTELETRELPRHALTFGSFSLEWDIKTLIEMGAIPVFYVPLRSTAGAVDGFASAMLARLGEIQTLLERVESLRDAPNVLRELQAGIQPASVLVNALRTIAGYFYPTDHPEYTSLLGYYRQREWRLLGNWVRKGIPVTVPVSENDVEALLRINPEFFGEEIEFRSGRQMRARGCQLYKTFREASVLQSIRRLICPRTSMVDVEGLLRERRVKLKVVALEDYATPGTS